ncbi:MAG: N-formylglutamate amidohydrolase [Gammaproteobacteria bacterium]
MTDRVIDSLLGADDPAPVEEVRPPVPEYPVLLVCDHASARIPAALFNLGLAPLDLGRHIAVDIGAAALTRGVAALLGLPAVLSRYSRLVVDCNRHLDDPSAFPKASDDTVIPGNQDLPQAERDRRVAAIYRPYHAAVREALAKLGPLPGVVAIHSFTPEFAGVVRPWHVGILWDQDAGLAEPLIAALRVEEDLCVGDNEPYSGRHPAGYTMDAHAESRGLPHVSIEVRQDLLATPAGIRRWTALLATALRPILQARFGTAVATGTCLTPDGH